LRLRLLRILLGGRYRRIAGTAPAAGAILGARLRQQRTRHGKNEQGKRECDWFHGYCLTIFDAHSTCICFTISAHLLNY
jgi:hypothetical protein